jgi:hypothetical protein
MQLRNLAAWWNARKQDRDKGPFASAASEELYELLDEASMVSRKR